jgi:plastocyanin
MRNRCVLFALVLPVIGACSDSGSSSPVAASQTSVPAAAATTTTVAAAAAPTDVPNTTVVDGTATAESGAVGIKDFKFDPAEVHVPVGGSVVWTNNDAQQHTATSSGNFDAGAIQPGTSATVQFTTAGSFTYICSFHPFMMGTVVVG